jgi:uncharacterized membrane protein
MLEKGEVMSSNNVVVVRFDEPSKAYEALTVLKQCAEDDRIGLESAALVERSADGSLHVVESAGNVGLRTVSGSLIGMLIGILGGPIGVLLGWGSGAVVGGAVDVQRAGKSYGALGMLGNAIPPGSNALIANVSEPSVEVIDGEMGKLDGNVTRRTVEEVMDELESVEEAADAAAQEARRTMREKHKAEVTAALDERVAKLKEKLHAS